MYITTYVHTHTHTTYIHYADMWIHTYTCIYAYMLLHNHNFLTDINECNNNSTCDQRCINTIGSVICECNPGYELNDDSGTCSGV